MKLKKINRVLWGISLLLGLSAVNSSFADDDSDALARGKKIATDVCAACHMADGRGLTIANVESRPRLTGIHPDYLINQIKAFKNDNRKNPSMKPFADMLSDEQITDVSKYFASLEAIKDDSIPEADEKLVKEGEKLVKNGDWNRYIPACTTCHGAELYGVGSTFPNINGQHPDYIRASFSGWKNDKRRNDPQALMTHVAKRLSDQQIDAVAAYLAQRPAEPAKK